MTPSDLRGRQAGLELQDIAAAAELGTPVSTYRKWLTGVRRVPGILVVLVLALAFIRAQGLFEEWLRYRAGKDGTP
jgi:hypothetical protein